MVKRKECEPFPRSYLWGRRTVGSAAGERRWSHTTRWERRSVRPEKVKEEQVDSGRRGNKKKLNILRNQKGWSLFAEKKQQPVISFEFLVCVLEMYVWRPKGQHPKWPLSCSLQCMATQQWRAKSSLFSLWIVVKWLNDTEKKMLYTMENNTGMDLICYMAQIFFLSVRKLPKILRSVLLTIIRHIIKGWPVTLEW